MSSTRPKRQRRAIVPQRKEDDDEFRVYVNDVERRQSHTPVRIVATEERRIADGERRARIVRGRSHDWRGRRREDE